MKWGSGSTESMWMGAGKAASETPLAMDINTEVCIVGAGIAGLSCQNVAGKSWYLTTGHLAAEKLAELPPT